MVFIGSNAHGPSTRAKKAKARLPKREPRVQHYYNCGAQRHPEMSTEGEKQTKRMQMQRKGSKMNRNEHQEGAKGGQRVTKMEPRVEVISKITNKVPPGLPK